MLLAIDKPKGITSYDVIRILKNTFPGQKIGHSGTLDPMATGLLIIGVGQGTKRLTELQGLSKSYITTIDFSQDSDTWDLDFWEQHQQFTTTKQDDNIGIIRNDNFFTTPTIAQLLQQLDKLIPSCKIPLTPFSAKKKGGKKLYELARKGEMLIEEKEMKTNSYKILAYDFPILKLELDVGSGTYIRSIGHWLGTSFSLGGVLTSLRRISIGDINIDTKSKEIYQRKKIKTEFKGKDVVVRYFEI